MDEIKKQVVREKSAGVSTTVTEKDDESWTADVMVGGQKTRKVRCHLISALLERCSTI